MTFQRSLYISLGLHVLIFGSVLAFAQLTRGALGGQWDVTVVSLVGSGSGDEGRKLQRRGHPDVVPDHKPEAGKEKTAPPAERPEMPRERESVREGASLPGGSISGSLISGGPKDNKVGTGDAGDDSAPNGQPDGQLGEGEAGSGTDEQFGAASAEQWAVIVSSIERVKSYPRMARERGIQGVVHLRFRVKPEGEVDSVEIVKSSGSEILDTASVRTVYRAAPMPYVKGWIEVPIAYVLK